MRKMFLGAAALGMLFYVVGCGHPPQKNKTTDDTARFSKEAADLQNKIRKNPGDARLRVQLGMHFVRTEQYNTALAHFDSALTLQPEMPAAQFGRAEANFLSGKLQT